MSAQDGGKPTVVVECRPQVFDGRAKSSVLPQWPACEGLQHRQPGAFVGLREDDVHPEQQRAIVGKDPLDQIGQPGTAPRPAPEFCQRTLVDIDDDDSVIDRRLREPAHAGVVQGGVESGQGVDLDVAQTVRQKHGEQQQPKQAAPASR
ncbi:MAG: hypothetical protein AW12_01089 [Candidatus Accumulibacter sp. BA-94]|nr:MAG: hypothetical protein AW12_01089 [Candidatus Accumulibacter sp. BA-94]